MTAESSKNLRLFASVIHEVRAPLHAILGLAELLVDSNLAPVESELASSIKQQATAMQLVVDDLLDLSRIDAGKLELIISPVSPRSLLRDVVTTFTTDAAAKGLDLSTVIDDEVPLAVRADGHRIRQVLVNLVSNAIKYTDTGSVTVRTSIGSESRLRFVVTDTGPGIDAEHLPKLFAAFEQTNVNHQHSGTGLGLSITSQLVELMGGEITVASSPTGSAFTVDLPVEPARRQQDLQEVAAPATTGATILVVDDTEVNRLVARSQLERLGHHPVLASGGEEGLALLLNEKFDLVLMDWHMPGLDGLSVIRRFLAKVEAGEVTDPPPIVMMTASVSDWARDECLGTGASGFLAKPVSLQDLDTCLSEWIKPSNELETEQSSDGLSADRSVIDQSVIDRLVDDLGGRGLVSQAIDVLLSEAATRRLELASPDLEIARRAAHTLKSTTLMFGALKLGGLLESLEDLLGKGPVDDGGLDEINRELDAAVAQLQKIKSDLDEEERATR